MAKKKTNIFFPMKAYDIPSARTVNTVTYNPRCARNVFEAILGTNNNITPSLDIFRAQNRGAFRIIPITDEYEESIDYEDTVESRQKYAESLKESDAYQIMKKYGLDKSTTIAYMRIDLASKNMVEHLPETMNIKLVGTNRVTLEYALSKLFRTGRVRVPGCFLNDFDIKHMEFMLRDNADELFEKNKDFYFDVLQWFPDTPIGTIYLPVLVQTPLPSSIITPDDMDGKGQFSMKTIHPGGTDVSSAAKVLCNQMSLLFGGTLKVAVASTLLSPEEINNRNVFLRYIKKDHF